MLSSVKISVKMSLKLSVCWTLAEILHCVSLLLLHRQNIPLSANCIPEKYYRSILGTQRWSFWIPHTTQTDRQAESPLLTQDDVSVPLHCLQQHFDLSEGEPWFGFQPCSYSSNFKLLIFIAPRGWHGWPLSRPSPPPPPPLMASNNSAWSPISPPSLTVSSRSTCQPGLKTPGWLRKGLKDQRATQRGKRQSLIDKIKYFYLLS